MGKLNFFCLLFFLCFYSFGQKINQGGTSVVSKAINLNDTLSIYNNQSFLDLKARVENLEKDNNKVNNPGFPLFPFIIGCIAIAFTIYLSWVTILIFNRVKEIDDKAEKYTKDIESKSKDIELKIEEFKELSKAIALVQKNVKGNQAFINTSLKNIFDFIESYISKKEEREFMDMFFLKKGISYLYSDDENVRFIGITILNERGKISHIERLQAMIINSDESDANKRLATDAISAIRLRSKK